jgi:N-hydroxyarylamine O-acetyltransferase
MEPDLDQKQFGKRYRLISTGGGLCLESNGDGAWKKEYVFMLQPRELSEFETMCHYHQTSPDSPFTRKQVCSVAAPAGRTTVSGDSLIETRYGVRQERTLTEDERIEVLKERFGVNLP